MKVQELPLPLVHNTDLSTMGARVTVVVYEKYFTGDVDTLAAAQTAVVVVSVQSTRRLLMGKRRSALALAVDAQLDAFVTSGGGLYCKYCPKPRNAVHPEINWKPAAATSASGIS